MPKMKVTAVDFSEGISKLAGRMGVTLIPNDRIPWAKALEPGPQGVIVTTTADKLVLVPWHKISACDVEWEEDPKPVPAPSPLTVKQAKA